MFLKNEADYTKILELKKLATAHKTEVTVLFKKYLILLRL